MAEMGFIKVERPKLLASLWQKWGGIIDEKDLVNYQAKWRKL